MTTESETDAPAAEEETAPLQRRTLALILIVCSLIGLFCALALSIEKITLLENPGRGLQCDLNAAVQCTEVMRSWQSNLFGFPNPYVGLMGFAITLTVGMALLAGSRFAQWFWNGLQLGVTLGAIFVHWLMFNTLFDIKAVCPYCMGVWVITMPMFFFVTARNAYRYEQGHTGALASIAGFLARMPLALLIIWYLFAAVLVIGMIAFGL